ncbi:MAG: hypothetical protein PHR68_00880 [Candidatus Gracilibacteria bacterium]|nr:hypothetical protein [Candidatus Gracilibacteria bacterium]
MANNIEKNSSIIPKSETELETFLNSVNLKAEVSNVIMETFNESEKLKEEVIYSTLSGFMVENSINNNSKINFSINGSNIIIDGKEYNAGINIKEDKLRTNIKDYLYITHSNKKFNKDIFAYLSEKLKSKDFNYLKNALNNENELKKIIKEYLGDNYEGIFSFVDINEFGRALKAKLYLETKNNSLLENTNIIDDFVKDNPKIKPYLENFNNANPLLKAGAGIIIIYKLFSFITDKMEGKWLDTLFGWGAIELIGQIATGKTITGEAIGQVSKLFGGTNNGKELEEIGKKIEKKENKIDLSNFGGLAIALLGIEPDNKKYTKLDWISNGEGNNSQKQIINFICENNKISKRELQKNVEKGRNKLINDIGYDIKIDDFNNISGDRFADKLNNGLDRGKIINNKINEIKTLTSATESEIKSTFKENFRNFIESGTVIKLDLGKNFGKGGEINLS